MRMRGFAVSGADKLLNKLNALIKGKKSNRYNTRSWLNADQQAIHQISRVAEIQMIH